MSVVSDMNEKAFDLKRFAKMELSPYDHDDAISYLYFIPADIQQIEEYGNRNELSIVFKDSIFTVKGSAEDLEKECNRALGEMEETVKRIAKKVEERFENMTRQNRDDVFNGEAN